MHSTPVLTDTLHEERNLNERGEEHERSFQGTSRFEVVRRLGTGAFGTVYEAFDRDEKTSVALKLLNRKSARDIQRFKREFRELADIRHPNLVSLFELHQHEQNWFFTMELVRGVSFLDWVWEPVPSPSAHAHERPLRVRVVRTRIIGALAQLVQGLQALHQTGHVHCDIKASNVMVTQEGRVVVLDFGLVAAMDRDPIASVVGTPGYIAPEVLAGMPPSPQSDWFSVGAMLHLAARGELPYPALGEQVFGPLPSKIVNADELEDIAALARKLLSPAASERVPENVGNPAEIQERHPSPGRGTLSASSEIPLVGRDEQIGLLHRALESVATGRRACVLVHGGSGIGKTRLVRQFMTRIRNDAVILEGSCREREYVPFQAFDAVVDDLVRHLLRLPAVEQAQHVPRDAYALARLFPAFLALPGIAASRPRSMELPEVQELRRRAFASLRELFGRVAARRPLVVAIDDLQWGDRDSAVLLDELLAPDAAPAMLFILSFRSDGKLTGRLSESWKAVVEGLSPADAHAIELAPLCVEETARVVASLVGERATEAPSSFVQSIVGESAGNPFFIQQLVSRSVRSGMFPEAAPSIRETLALQVAELSPGARFLGEALALLGKPADLETALALAADPDADRATLRELLRARFVSLYGGYEGDTVEVAHDQWRDALVSSIPEEKRPSVHRFIGEVLERLPRHATEPLLIHWHFAEAKDFGKASQFAEIAADRAASALAFRQAAELYQKALEHASEPERRARLRLRLAEALSDAGSGAAAATLYDELSAYASPGEAEALRLRATENYLASGHLQEGLRALRSLSKALGVAFPATPRSAKLACFRLVLDARFRRPRSAPASVPPDPREALRMDVCYSAAKGLIGVDAERGAYFALRALQLATEAGDPERVARYQALVGGAILATAGGRLGTWGNRMMAAAQEQVLRHPDNRELRGTFLVCQGHMAVLDGRWADGLTTFDQALATVESCRSGVCERSLAEMGALRALEELGHFPELRSRIERLLRRATQDGDVYAEVTARIFRGLARVATGDIAGAREDEDAALSGWPLEGYDVQHMYALRVHVFADLYEGRPARAWHRVAAAWPSIERYLLLEVPTSRIDAMLMRGRSALALAAQGDEQGGRLVKLVEETCRTLRRERRPDVAAHAALLHAGALTLRGETQRALTLVAEAEERFDALSMTLYAACAAVRRGALEGVSEQAARRKREAIERMVHAQIAAPEAWIGVHAPGFGVLTSVTGLASPLA